MEKTVNRENWIDAIKGIACIIVFCQHFTLSFANSSLWDNGLFRIKWLAFTVNGNFSVCLFLLISFYLTAKKILQKEITSRDIASLSVKRYCRLVIPVAIASLFAFVIQETIGFQNHVVSLIDENTWFDGFYNDMLTVRNLISTVFYRVLWNGDYRFNGPFWMLTTLFIGFFETIIITCIAKHIRKVGALAFFLTALFLIYYLQNSLLLISVLGVLLAVLNSNGQIKNISEKGMVKAFSCSIILLLLIIMGYENDLILCIRDHVRTDSYLLQRPFWNAIMAFVILLCCMVIFEGRKIQDNNVAVYIGRRGMGIYLFHWPIICSISSVIYIKYLVPLSNKGGGVVRIIILFVLTLLLTMILSEVYTRLVERRLVRTINKNVDGSFI